MQQTILVFGIVCVIAAIVGGGVKLIGHEIPLLSQWWRQLLLGLFGLVLIIVALCCVGRPTNPTPIPIKVIQVYPPFGEAHGDYQYRLGSPIAEVQINPNRNGGSQDQLEHAVNLFLDKSYVLYEDDHHYWERTEQKYPSQDYFNQDALRKLFRPLVAPPHLGYPVGSLADDILSKRLGDWQKQIGWLEWECSFASLSYQVFEHGRIIGTFYARPVPAKDQRGQIFVLFDDRTWESRLADPKDTPASPPNNCTNYTAKTF